MKHQTINPGGVAVGRLADLEPVEALAVVYLRHWAESSDIFDRFRNDLAASAGQCASDAAFDSFGKIATLLGQFGRRPLMRHQPDCLCLGADEACFANLIGCALRCEREDAAMIASLIVRPDMCLTLAGQARACGLALHRLVLRGSAPRAAAASPPDWKQRTLH